MATAVKGSTSVSYKYGADGLRTQKTLGSTVYNYYYIDGVLVRQTWGTNYMDFLYDESGSAYSFIYNGTQYYYVKNLQGDVMRIVDTSGTVVANYTYDAWGKVTNSGNIVGLYNPIRYRGYYYDTDTGFYYLQSRYYDPAIKRFISADDASLLGANGDFTSLNLYAYCGNNPVARSDDGGEAWNIAIGAAIGAIAGGLLGGFTASKNGGNIFTGALTGAALGAVTGAIVGSGNIVMISGGLSKMASKAATDAMGYAIYGTNVGTWEDYAIAFVSGGTSALSGPAASKIDKVIDVAIRPAANQLVKCGTRGKTFDEKKYLYDVATRFVTSNGTNNKLNARIFGFNLKVDMGKSVYRATTRGFYPFFVGD